MDTEILVAFVSEFAGGMPREIGKQLEDVEIIVAPTPEIGTQELNEIIETDDGKELEPLPADCKGAFIGEQMEVEEDADGEGEFETASLPNGAIVLIAGNIANTEEAALVLLHEIGHALGMDEEGVKALGLGVSPSAGATTNGGNSSANGNQV